MFSIAYFNTLIIEHYYYIKKKKIFRFAHWKKRRSGLLYCLALINIGLTVLHNGVTKISEGK